MFRLPPRNDIEALLDIEQACLGTADREMARRRALPLLTDPATLLFACADGVPVACAGTITVDDIAVLIAAMCRPEHRGRGLQAALIRARLERVAGVAELAVSSAAPGSTSERNLRRSGLDLIATALLFQRAVVP